jgi:aminomethyltransferase
MSIATPFHPRTSALCTSLFWKEWAGHYAVRSYDNHHEPEYFAIRHAAALIDVSPLFKYDVSGPDAATFLSWVMVRDMRTLKVGRVTYLCWCDDHGKVLDDGTVSRYGEQEFRVTSAEPALAWLARQARRYDVRIEDVSERIATLSLQGPRSRDILNAATGSDLRNLKFFAGTPARVRGIDIRISRTGYTGDLGYELWIDREQALPVWDALMEAGKPHHITPTGLDAMDVSRIEAGFILNGVDYFSAHRCVVESRKSTPYEIGLGWTVNLAREPFVGQAALGRERARGSIWAKVGLMLDWNELEALFAKVGLPPHVSSAAWRTAVPVYDRGGRQIGQATSGAWSPTLKQNLALATVEAAYAEPGTRIRMEVTVEFQRHRITATVTKTPFFNPERKRA